MNREDIIRMAREAHGEMLASMRGMYLWHDDAFVKDVQDFCGRFAALVAAEKDKEIELLRADAKRLDWCISVLYRQNGKDSYLVFDTGCGCCGDAKRFDCSISGRDAIDDAIRARGEQEQPR